MSDPIILALDQSTRLVGWCVAQGNLYLASGCHDLDDNGKRDAWYRLARLRDWLAQMMETYDPDVVIVERPTGDHGNVGTSVKLGAALGVTFAMADERRIPMIEVYPSQVKATGYHKGALMHAALLAEKGEVGEDEADALGVWQAGLIAMRERAL